MIFQILLLFVHVLWSGVRFSELRSSDVFIAVVRLLTYMKAASFADMLYGCSEYTRCYPMAAAMM